MVVVPLKWVPALLLIGGIMLLVSGESVGGGLLLSVIGGIWSFCWYTRPTNPGT